ncbi:MAG: ParB/RepB/Spo0J family partition protein [Candidatus Omnitrophota bacterium]
MALGRGLSALIAERKEEVPSMTDAQLIETASIKDNRFQPRQTYDIAKIDELAASIKEQGLLQPLIVRAIDQGFEVVAGERRLKAARKLGLLKVPVIVRNVTDQQALVLALVENLQREELNPIEEAESFRRLVDEFKQTQEDVARLVSKDRATVANLLRLLKLPKDIQRAVADGRISAGHARAILAIESVEQQKVLFARIVEEKLSVREAEALTKVDATQDVTKNISKIKPLKDPEIATLEAELRGIFGVKVQVCNARGNKGKLVIEYYSLDDFDRILEVIRR